MKFTRGILMAIAATALASAAPVAAQRSDLIRGRVTSDSGRALAGVSVIATMAPDRRVQRATTDTGGRYALRFEAGTGDYLVYVAPIGYGPFRRRVARRGTDSVIVVDVKLVAEATRLAAVNTSAPRPRSLPDFGLTGDPTGAEQFASGLTGALPSDQLGNLLAMAATVPGITATADGSLVAFGMPGQVSTAFNGVALATASIPADVRATVRVTSSAYDPSVGGFGGARVNVEMAQGGRVPETFGRLTLDTPALQDAGPRATHPRQQFTQFAANGLAHGPVGERDMWYNTAVQVRRRAADAISFFDADPSVLALAGIAADSADRLRALASAQGIPLTQTGLPTLRTERSASFIGRVDRYPDPARYRKLWSNATALTTMVSLGESDAPGGAFAASPSVGQRSTNVAGQVIGTWLHIGESYSSEFTNSFAGARSTGEPYVPVPAALVRVSSHLGGTSPVVNAFSLGGSPSSSAASNGSLESIGVIGFYLGSSHKIKLYARSLLETAQTSSRPNVSGSFSYNSLSDLASNAPSGFTRSLSNPVVSASAWRGALSVGDLWQLTPALQLQPGIRLEANHFFTTPTRNPAVDALLGFSNTGAPSTVHASPRLGFAYTFARATTLRTGGGSIGLIALPPRGVLSGGIGEFRNDIGAAAILGPLALTGLPTAARQLSCYGAATPTPAWRSYSADPATIPTQCAAGAPPPLADVSPNVQLFDPEYRLARSWRGNLQWGSTFKSLRYSVNAVYSRNVDQPGLRDLNFGNAPQFTLASEGGRPVFAGSASIVPTTGIVSPTTARRSAALGPVIGRFSDLRSTARQATLSLAPEMSRAILRLDYTVSDVREDLTGYEGSTFGSPVVRERGRSRFDARHNVMVSTGYRFGIGIGASLYLNARSGMPYTPMVGSDVNGDGLANDRAFVFDPARLADPVFSNAMTTLLSSAPSGARACLARQIGVPASSNSCEGPWTASMNAALSTAQFHILDGRVATIEMNFANPLAALDQVLHGSRNIHGWGAPAFVDRTLYTVRGFDTGTNQFQYAVNPRFGNSRQSETVLRAPFRMTLNVRIELGTPVRSKQFARFRAMDPIRRNHAAAPVDSLRVRLSDVVSNPYAMLLRSRDSLLLTVRQVESLTVAEKRYRAQADSVWSEVAATIIEQGDAVNLKDITRRVDAAKSRVWSIQRGEIPRIMAILVPVQQDLVRIMLKPIIESDKRRPPSVNLF